MIIAFDVNQTWEYSLKQDEADEKTIFILGVLDSRLSSFLTDKARTFEVNRNGLDAPATVMLDLDQQNYRTVQFGLRGWQNFKDKNGKDIPFETKSESIPHIGNRNSVSPKCMDFIKPYINELAAAILNENIPSKELEKN